MGVARGLFELDLDYYQRISREYMGKRDRICAALEKGGFYPYIPEGAYYVLADISGLPGKNSKERAMYLLNKTSVAYVPGEAFYHDSSGEEVARFCFAKDDTALDSACEKIAGLR